MKKRYAILLVLIALVIPVGVLAISNRMNAAQTAFEEFVCGQLEVDAITVQSTPVVRVICQSFVDVIGTPSPGPVGTVVTEPTDTGVPEPTATQTLEPTATQTLEPTATITPTPAITIPPPPTPDHNLLTWHPATAELSHSHGVDPMSTIFATFIADFFPEHEITLVSHPWLTSSQENGWPAGVGKHDGFVWLYEPDTGCDQFDPGGGQSPGPCVKSYLLQVHTMRTGVAQRTRFHSESVIALVCQTGGGEPCDIVYSAGWADYGQNHSRYKRDVCWQDPANPYPESAGSNIYLNQPPYRTGIGSSQTGIFWSSLINTLGRSFIDPDPSNIIEVAWNDLDAFSTESVGDNCFNSEFDNIFPNQRGTKHQVFSVYLHLDGFPRPFEGWTDVHGNRRDDCASVHDAGCVPLYIGPNVPEGTAYMNRAVMHGDNNVAPIQDFYNGFMTVMNPYGYDH